MALVSGLLTQLRNWRGPGCLCSKGEWLDEPSRWCVLFWTYFLNIYKEMTQSKSDAVFRICSPLNVSLLPNWEPHKYHQISIQKSQRYNKGYILWKRFIEPPKQCQPVWHGIMWIFNIRHWAACLPSHTCQNLCATPARSKSGWSTYVCQWLTGGLGLFIGCGAWFGAQLRSLKQPQDQGHQMPLAVVALRGIHLHQIHRNVLLEGILWTHCLLRGTMIHQWGHKSGKTFHSCCGLMMRVKGS